MKLDFSAIEETSYPAFKGGEKELVAKMFFDGALRVIKGRLAPGATIGMHTHSDSCEVIFITAGRGCAIYDGTRIPLSEGDVHYCPKGHTHSLVNDSSLDMSFTAVVPAQ